MGASAGFENGQCAFEPGVSLEELEQMLMNVWVSAVVRIDEPHAILSRGESAVPHHPRHVGRATALRAHAVPAVARVSSLTQR
jgi:hypothetical protein